MNRHRRFRWLPFYLLFPLAGALFFLDDDIRMSDTWHMIILGAIAVLICGLALLWIERHSWLAESVGVDSLRGHHLLAGMTTYWPHEEDEADSEGHDVQFTPVRLSRLDE